MSILSYIKDGLSWILVVVCLGYITFLHNNLPVSEKVIEKPVVQEIVKREVINTIQVKEKEKSTDADIVVDTNDSLKVSLNGKPFYLAPNNASEYNFGKDYVELKQSSIYNINISNEPLEPSWGIGVGVTDNKKVAGIITARLRATPTHLWVMSDGKTTAGGILFSTNYK